VVSREPANPIAWLLCGLGAFVPVAVLLNGGAAVGDPAHGIARLGAWVGLWAPYAALFPIAIFVPLLFPDGRLPSPRWRLAAWCTVAGIVARGAGAVVVRDLLSILGGLAIPIAIAVAMLRYRLYDVDRLISRSLTYAAVTLVLAAAYAGLVLAGQALFSSFA